jgi:hypothetical protein
MKKFLLLTVAATAMAMAIAALETVQASPIISIDAPITGAVTFTGNGLGDLGVIQGALSGGGSDAVDGASLGTITITSSAYNTGPQILGIFGVLGTHTSSLVYTNGGNTLDEIITWASVDDGSINPHLFGLDVVTGVSGSAAFDAAFSVGELSTIDVEAASVGTVLDTLAGGHSSETVGFSSGEIQFLAAVPEPKLLLVMLMAIGTIFLLYRHRHS